MNEASQFDLNKLAALKQITRDAEDLHSLLAEFVTASDERIRAIHGTNESESIRRMAHPMKSGAMTIGALGFAALCRSIEETAKNRQLDEMQRLILELDTSFAQVLDWLRVETGYKG